MNWFQNGTASVVFEVVPTTDGFIHLSFLETFPESIRAFLTQIQASKLIQG